MRYNFRNLNEKSTWDEQRTKFYAAEIVLGLEALHKEGYVHRDLKFANVLIDDKGHVKLSDFGLAIKLGENEKASAQCGTYQYMAPEILQGTGYDRMVDWWSLVSLKNFKHALGNHDLRNADWQKSCQGRNQKK